jgi:serine/threonine protein kinase
MKPSGSSSSQEVNIPNSDYTFNVFDLLGRGNSGTVYRGACTTTNEKVAVKLLIIDSTEAESNLQREIALLRDKDLQANEYIVKCYDVIQDSQNYYIIMELCDSSMKLYIEKNQLTEEESLKLMYQILQGYITMKNKNIIHRDLKPDNILIKQKIPKIADFGSAREKARMGLHTEDVGTLFFKAPEILAGDSKYDELVDVWSLGVTLYYMLYRDYPFKPQGFSQINMLEEIKTVAQTNLFKKNIKIKPETQELLSKMLEPDKKKRINWKQIETHAAFDKFRKNPSTPPVDAQRGSITRPETSTRTSVKNISVTDAKLGPSDIQNRPYPVLKTDYLFYPFQVVTRGSRGVIYKGFDKRTKEEVTVKHLSSETNIENIVKQENLFFKDTKLQGCEYLLRCLGVHNNNKEIYIISEYYDITLTDFSKRFSLSEEEALQILLMIIEGYQVLEKKKIYHKDLSIDNIIMKGRIAKIAEYGVARIRSSTGEEISNLLYRPPEILNGSQQYDELVDMWSLGCTFYYMLYRDWPYKPKQLSVLTLVTEIREQKFTNLFKKEKIVLSKETQDLIMKMLEPVKEKRIKWDEILRHPSFDKIKRQKLIVNPIKDNNNSPCNSPYSETKQMVNSGSLEKQINGHKMSQFNPEYTATPHIPQKKPSLIIEPEQTRYLTPNPQRGNAVTAHESGITNSPGMMSGNFGYHSDELKSKKVVEAQPQIISNFSPDPVILDLRAPKKQQYRFVPGDQLPGMPNENHAINTTFPHSPSVIVLNDDKKKVLSQITTTSNKPAEHRGSGIQIVGVQDLKK